MRLRDLAGWGVGADGEVSGLTSKHNGFRPPVNADGRGCNAIGGVVVVEGEGRTPCIAGNIIAIPRQQLKNEVAGSTIPAIIKISTESRPDKHPYPTLYQFGGDIGGVIIIGKQGQRQSSGGRIRAITNGNVSRFGGTASFNHGCPNLPSAMDEAVKGYAIGLANPPIDRDIGGQEAIVCRANKQGIGIKGGLILVYE